MWKSEKPVHILIHLSGIGVLIFLIALVFFKVYLPTATNYGEKIVVPVLNGKSLNEAKEIIESAGLRFLVYDSTYQPGKPGHQVISQHPEAASEVKSNRKIYLTITTVKPPKIKMPALTDRSLKSASLALKNRDLKLGSVNYENSPFKDLVLKQLYNGKEIAEGTFIPKSSKIDLIVGNGQNEQDRIAVPLLSGLEVSEVETTLLNAGLKLSSIFTQTDIEEKPGVVVEQKPAQDSANSVKVLKGSYIDIWVTE